MNQNSKDGLAGLIIPTMSRSKLISIKTLIKKRYLLNCKKKAFLNHEIYNINRAKKNDWSITVREHSKMFKFLSEGEY